MLGMKKWPGFLPTNHFLFRIEYAVLCIGLLMALHWRALNGGLDLGLTLLFLLLPDAPFLAILPALKRNGKDAGQWPEWAAAAYNVTHSYVTWMLMVGLAWHVTSIPWWPLLGAFLHVSIDRAIGFSLREAK